MLFTGGENRLKKAVLQLRGMLMLVERHAQFG